MAEKLSTILHQINPLFGRCENCGHGLRHADKDGMFKWCKRCIDIYYRKEKMKPEKAERIILGLVDTLYLAASIEKLDEKVRESLLGLKYGQDAFLFGPVGTGKTYAMAAMIRKYVYEGYKCERINFDDFCVKIRSTMSPAAKQTEWEVVEPLKNIDKLFIDDLGLRSKLETDFSYFTFYSMLNKRLERMLPTFISSNKTTEQIGQTFDVRVASRLQEAKLIPFTGADRRIKDSLPMREK